MSGTQLVLNKNLKLGDISAFRKKRKVLNDTDFNSMGMIVSDKHTFFPLYVYM